VPLGAELSSWKQISSYLGVSIRTAQTLERERGLPVRRVTGPRGRVTTTVRELDTWKRGADRPTMPPEPPATAIVTTVSRPWWHRRQTWLVLLVVIAGVAAVAARTHAVSVRPSSWRIERDTLVILDDQGRECWRKVFPYTLAEATLPEYASRYTWIGDLDGDGHQEVLFAPHPTEGSESTPLICYSERGVERWRFVNQRRVRTSAQEFTPTFGIARFLVTSLGTGGPNAVLVATTHHLYYPSQVALLSPQGKVLREYWHSGHLNHLQAADLDNDGKMEFYLAGINNAWHAATLVVLDLDHFGGASQEPQSPDHQLQGFPIASERSHVILPRSCLNTTYDPYNPVATFTVGNGEIMVQTTELIGQGAGILHHLTPDLQHHRAVLSDSYHVAYQRAALAGELQHCTLDDNAPQTLQVITSPH
jgi:hypothetical protein